MSYIPVNVNSCTYCKLTCVIITECNVLSLHLNVFDFDAGEFLPKRHNHLVHGAFVRVRFDVRGILGPQLNV